MKSQQYFATFIPGIGEIVIDQLSDVIELQEGFVVFSGEFSMQMYNNVYLLLGKYKINSVEELAKNILNDKSLKDKIRLISSERHRSYRIRFSDKNIAKGIRGDLLEKLEELFIDKAFRVDRTSPDDEIFGLVRDNGYGYFGLRISPSDSNKNLAKGELRPQLTWILCHLSEPNKEDIFWDPFAGSGAIARMRVNVGLSKKIMSTDIIKEGDFGEVSKKFDFKVNKIVTDPPWGIYEKVDIENLYNRFLSICEKILDNNGVLIILVSRFINLEELLSQHKNLKILKVFKILVSGKPASIYKIVLK
ncbi:MAG: hypothetical protein Q8L51_01330 [Candidatus Amesbacteria bacterium]|nr:hypothetical protein [Candidatus Amesbacteria bacterium]